MPELPEVESVRRMLAAILPGRALLGLRVSGLPLRRACDHDALAALVGARFALPERRAKYALLPLLRPADGARLGVVLLHLGMAGRVRITSAEAPVEPHTHVIFELDRGEELRFVDPRRFGFVAWLPEGSHDPALDALGLDPLADDFPAAFAAAAHPSKRAIKAVLLDQHVVGGIGNIYAAEALWRAGIHPRARADKLSKRRLRLLADAVAAVLRDAIAASGTSFRDYRTPDGAEGWFATQLAVYGRADEPCKRCGAPLTLQEDQGRSTVFCRHCQKR